MQQSTRFFSRRTAMVIVALAALVAFLPALAGGFVYDDESLVRDNANLRALLAPSKRSQNAAPTTPLRALLFSDFSRIAGDTDGAAIRRVGYFRPVIAASYLVDGFFWSRTTPRSRGSSGFALDPFGFHLTNLLLHVAVSLLVWTLARGLAGGTAGLIAGVLFAVHPVHAENVAWIAGRTDLFAAFFALASLVCCCRFLRPRARTSRAGGMVWLGSAVTLFALAAFSKESALFLPLFALVLGVLPASRVIGHRRFVPALALGAVALAYFGARLAFATSSDGVADPFIDADGQPLGIATLAASFIRAIGWYGAKLFWPASFEPMADVAFATPAAMLLPVVVHVAILAVAIALVATRRPAQRSSAIGLGLIGTYLALLPVSSIVPGLRLARAVEDQMFPVAERFLYLPSAFLMLAVGTAVTRLTPSRSRWPVLAVVAAIACISTTTSWNRAYHYRNNTTFFYAASEAAGWSVRIQCGLGRVALEAWRIDKALDHFRFAKQALETRRPGAVYPPIDAGLAAAYREKGDEPRLVEIQKRVMERQPRAWLPPFQLGVTHWVNAVIHKDIARLQFAIAMMDRAASLAPNEPDIRLARDHLEFTRSTWDRYYVKREFSEPALVALARTFNVPAMASLNEPGGPRWGDALKILHRALVAIPPGARLADFPAAAAARQDLERTYDETMTAAIAWYEGALERYPWSVVLRHQLGEIFGIAWLRTNDGTARDRALEHFWWSLETAPGFLRAIVDNAALLQGKGNHAVAIARVKDGVRALLEPGQTDGWQRPMRPYEALDAIRLTAAAPELPAIWREMAAEMIEEIVTAVRKRAEAGTVASDWDDLGWVLVYAGRTLGEPARYLEAKAAFERALACDPKHVRARTNLRALEAQLAKGPQK